MILLFHHSLDLMQSLKHQKLDICGQIEGILDLDDLTSTNTLK